MPKYHYRTVRERAFRDSSPVEEGRKEPASDGKLQEALRRVTLAAPGDRGYPQGVAALRDLALLVLEEQLELLQPGEGGGDEGPGEPAAAAGASRDTHIEELQSRIVRAIVAAGRAREFPLFAARVAETLCTQLSAAGTSGGACLEALQALKWACVVIKALTDEYPVLESMDLGQLVALESRVLDAALLLCASPLMAGAAASGIEPVLCALAEILALLLYNTVRRAGDLPMGAADSVYAAIAERGVVAKSLRLYKAGRDPTAAQKISPVMTEDALVVLAEFLAALSEGEPFLDSAERFFEGDAARDFLDFYDGVASPLLAVPEERAKMLLLDEILSWLRRERPELEA